MIEAANAKGQLFGFDRTRVIARMLALVVAAIVPGVSAAQAPFCFAASLAGDGCKTAQPGPLLISRVTPAHYPFG